MASGQETVPSFDGLLFNNYDGKCTMYCEVAPVAGILQSIHFDGYDGDTVVHHGYPNRPWICQGRIIQNTSFDIIQYIADLESYLDDAFDDTWRTLNDSFGSHWPKARITQVAASNMKAVPGGWICELIVTGILDGSPVRAGPGVG